MNQDLYYVVTPEFEEIDEGVSELTGNKDIDLYEILGNKPHRLKTLTVDHTESSEDAIEEYLSTVAPELFSEDQQELYYTLTQL